MSIGAFARLFVESRYTVFFTGAGMSTESGLPDFRSAGGLWQKGRRFEELASVGALEARYEELVEFYRWRIAELEKYAPHRGHERIAAWEKRGLVHALVTQNVDGFHERAGSAAPINLHGTMSQVHCQRCRAKKHARAFLDDDGTRCACGGKMRPSVVLFGEMLPEEAIESATAASRRATLFVVLGSSLAVSPANTLPLIAKRHGSQLVIVNREPTPLHELADLTFDGAIGATLAEIDEALDESSGAR